MYEPFRKQNGYDDRILVVEDAVERVESLDVLDASDVHDDGVGGTPAGAEHTVAVGRGASRSSGPCSRELGAAANEHG